MSDRGCFAAVARVHASGLTLQVGTMRRFDPGISFARDFVREEIGELIALKAWYCDSAYRYQMTDTLQPLPRSSANARKPPGDAKSDRRRYYMIGHGSHLIDTARFLVGEEITSVRAELAERAGAHCWFQYHPPLGEDAHFWRRQVEGFADSVLTGAPQLGANVDDGLAAMRVMDAIEQSVETGATVAIDPTFATA